MAVYDPEKEKTLKDLEESYGSGSTDSDDLPTSHPYGNNIADLENAYSSPSANKDNPPDSQPDKPTSPPDLYNQGSGSQKGGKFSTTLKTLAKKRGFKYGAGGGGIIGLVIAIAAMGGFLNIFQLDHLMSNIENRSFTRNKSVIERRSDKWVIAYMQMRLLEMESNKTPDKRDNLYFRSNYDTGNPIKDWYTTLRYSKFEQEVFNKHGIIFTSIVGADGKIRAGAITIDGKKTTINPDFKGRTISQMRTNNTELNRLINSINTKTEDIFNTDKAGRAYVKKIVNENTHWWQVNKRRHVRKYIFNRTGIREWRFFETTRNKADTKVASVRNKLIKKMLPDTNMLGKVVQCVFGITSGGCRGGDAADPDNRAAEASYDNSKETDGKELEGTDPDGSEKKIEIPKFTAEAIEALVKNISKGMSAANFVGTMDMISNAIEGLSKTKGLVASYKAIQAITAFTTLNTMRDQMRTGEVTDEEVNVNMNLLANMGSNEAYSKVISGQTNTAKAASATLQTAKNKDEYCSSQYQEKLEQSTQEQVNNVYHYLCPEKQIGGLSGAAVGIDAFFNSTLGRALKQLASTWKSFTDNIIFDIVRTPFEWLGKAGSYIGNGILSAFGADDDVEKLVSNAMKKVGEVAGIKPLINENGPLIAGQVTQAAIQGGAATAESSMRQAGAALTTDKTRAQAIQVIAQYQAAEQKQQSVLSRYISLDNPDSATSKALSSFANIRFNIISIFNKFGNSLAGIFNFSNLAKADISPYLAAEVAGIDTYDYPSQCYNADPLSMTPQNSTNILSVLRSKGAQLNDNELTWDLVTDSNAFYDFLYQKLEAANLSDDEITNAALTVYNCALLDNDVRGDLGATFGYTKDHALVTDSNSTDTSAGTPGTNGWSLSSMTFYSQCDPKWAYNAFGSYGTVCSSGCGITSIAMAIATLNNDKNVTPATMATKYGSYHTVGTNWALLPVAARDYNLTNREIGRDFSAAKEILSQGGIIIASFDPGVFTSQGHFMIIRAFSEDGSKFYIADPYNGNHNGVYTAEYLINSGHLLNMWGYSK